jgi:hypothetical protein
MAKQSSNNDKLPISTLLAIRQTYSSVLRDEIDTVSAFLKRHFTAPKKPLDPLLVENFWDVGSLIVLECIEKHNPEKAKNLLEIFSDYKNLQSSKIQESFEELASSISSETSSEDQQNAEPKGNLMITADHTIGEDDGSPMGDSGNENPEYFF